MFKEDTYIKSIENYFLTHLGKGIMLSYGDYELISRWKDKNIPIEIIKEGIKKAFSEFNSFNKDTKIRNLNAISSYVEKSIKTYLEIQALDYNIVDDDSLNNSINNITGLINDNIKDIQDKRVLEVILDYKNSILNLSSNKDPETFKIISDKQNKVYDNIFNLLSESDKNNILTKCESKLKQSSNITRQAYQKSIISFRNELIKAKFNLKFLN